jgi:4-amino-4-deoxy-L-arabinose transferase-like glycosyltransferase
MGHLLVRFAPWSLLLIAFATVKQVREAFRKDPELLWLACWSLGGLLVMSLVPSKRFDRILPVIPPLCLLLVAMARHLPGFEFRTQPIGRLAILSSLLAILTSTAYAAFQVVGDYRTNHGALAAFGARVAHEVAGRGDRLAVISGKDEGCCFTPANAGSRTRTLRWRCGALAKPTGSWCRTRRWRSTKRNSRRTRRSRRSRACQRPAAATLSSGAKGSRETKDH